MSIAFIKDLQITNSSIFLHEKTPPVGGVFFNIYLSQNQSVKLPKYAFA